MEETNFNINEIIKIEQLPKIFYQLELIGKEIDKKLEGIDKLECTEENKVEVKNKRAEINNLNKIMEDKRKDIKKEILKDYETFNEKYEQEIKSKLTSASETLSNKINEIENEQKEIGKANLIRYFDEYKDFLHINDIIQFEDLNLNITLTNLGKNLDGKKYKDEIKLRLDSIANDIKLINLEEYKEEIMLEYKTCLDFAKAKLIVVNRHSAIDSIRVQQEEKNKQIEEEKKIEEKVDEIIAPKEIIEDRDIITVTFTVKGTKEKIKELKNKIIELELEYE